MVFFTNFFVTHTLETGMSSSKDFLTEYFLFSYSFKSKNRHTFTIRNYHIGYARTFYCQFALFNFAFMVGLSIYIRFLNLQRDFFFLPISVVPMAVLR